MHHTREEAHGAGETISAKPAQHLLSTVREKDHAELEPKERGRRVIFSGNQFANLERVPFWGSLSCKSGNHIEIDDISFL